MAIDKVARGESEQKAQRAREDEDRHELLAFESKETRELAVRRMTENREVQTGEEKTTKAVTEASRHNAERGADWRAYADREAHGVPVSVAQLAAQNTAHAARVEQDNQVERVHESEHSNQARNDAQRDAVRRQAEQQMTVAEIQAELMRRSGLVRG